MATLSSTKQLTDSCSLCPPRKSFVFCAQRRRLSRRSSAKRFQGSFGSARSSLEVLLVCGSASASASASATSAWSARLEMPWLTQFLFDSFFGAVSTTSTAAVSALCASPPGIHGPFYSRATAGGTWARGSVATYSLWPLSVSCSRQRKTTAAILSLRGRGVFFLMSSA